MGLKEEIAEKRKEIVVESYPMSIGEMINLYKDEELEVHPEFQRFFRWDEEQKSKLIESLLLGIPIPPIFVAQKLNGRWDVIDGQQRLSTILQFAQVLKKEDGKDYEPLVLKGTKFLPSLEGVLWSDLDKFTEDQRITFKREKLNFTIIKESTETDLSKYEMFQRLNTSGTHLTPQELRNCLLIMINKEFYKLICELNKNTDFITCIPITENQTEERYDMELVVRYIVYNSISDEEVSEIDKARNMDNFLTERIETIAQGKDITEYELLEDGFKRVFKLLNETFSDDSFRKMQNGEHKGPLLISAFEAIIPGLSFNIDYWETNKDELRNRINNIYSQKEFINATKRGVRPIDRMCQMILFSRKWFLDENKY